MQDFLNLVKQCKINSLKRRFWRCHSVSMFIGTPFTFENKNINNPAAKVQGCPLKMILWRLSETLKNGTISMLIKSSAVNKVFKWHI